MSQESQPAFSTSIKQKQIDSSGYLSQMTIAALSTPTGGALCVLKISGSRAFEVVEKITHKKEFFSRKMTRTWIYDEAGKKIDDILFVCFKAPNSYTGEDLVEFYLHGSSMVAQKVLELSFLHGTRMALPGEFSFRAVKNGKLFLSQAEAVKELIAADNDFSLDLAIEKLSGSQHSVLLEIKSAFLHLVTLAEVGIDFSDQDIEEVSLLNLKLKADQLLNDLMKLKGSFDRGKRFLDGIPVSIFGLPNAGKSSFFNALLGEDRSIVSNVAGTTRDVIREKLVLQGRTGKVAIKISDTAGLRKIVDPVEEIGIERSLKAAVDSDIILLVLDGTRPEPEVLSGFIQLLSKRCSLKDKRILGMITKKDLINTAQQKQLIERLSAFQDLDHLKNWTFISSMNLEGISDVAQKITDEAVGYLKRNPGEMILTQFVHVQAVHHSIECLKRALNHASDLVLFASDIRHGMNELGPLIGETQTDDILGKIFSDFCIGK